MRFVSLRSSIAIAVLALCGAVQPAQASMIEFSHAAAWSSAADTPVLSFLDRRTRGMESLSTFINGSDTNPSCGFMTIRACEGNVSDHGMIEERERLSDTLRGWGVDGSPRSSDQRAREGSGSSVPGVTTVPEPATLLLTAIGIVGTAAFRRRRVQ